MKTTARSAFYGHHCTHVHQREDAIWHNGRDYVPTIYGQETGNTIYVNSLAEMYAVGAVPCFNEDQTEIHLTLPVGHKFSIKMLDKERAVDDLIEALKKVTAQLAALAEGEADDPSVGITGWNECHEDIAKARAALAKAGVA